MVVLVLIVSYLVQGKECIAQRAFTEQERAESSTYRELLAFVETWTNRQIWPGLEVLQWLITLIIRHWLL